MIKYDNKQQFAVERGFLNRAKIYLYPAVVLLKSYRPAMVELKNDLLCVSYFNNSIVLYYNRGNSVIVKRLIDTLKKNEEYIDHWMHNQDVFAIRIAPDLNYDAFEEGRYTDIYSLPQINKVFTPQSKTRKILTKDLEYKQEYVDLLNKWFNTYHTIDSLEQRDGGKKAEIKQYDLPPCMNQEVFNYEDRRTVAKGSIRPPETEYD